MCAHDGTFCATFFRSIKCAVELPDRTAVKLAYDSSIGSAKLATQFGPNIPSFKPTIVSTYLGSIDGALIAAHIPSYDSALVCAICATHGATELASFRIALIIAFWSAKLATDK